MNLIESFKIAIASIRSNKFRSFLTMLGLIIGISSVVTIVAIGNGSQNSIKSKLDDLGTNVITLQSSRGVRLTTTEKLNISDVEALNIKYQDEILGIVPQINISVAILEDVEDTSLTLTSSGDQLSDVESVMMLYGREFTFEDIEAMKNNIIIDSALAEEIYGDSSSALGQQLFLNSQYSYKIIGVYEKEESNTGFNTAKGYVPYTTLQKNYNAGVTFSSIKIALASGVDPSDFGDQVVNYIGAKKGNAEDNKYTTYSLEEQIEMISSVMSSLTLLVSAIAAISLIVGGIGVMNIMLVSVTERTREIGIRKALGAKYNSILMQFLIESVVVSGLGGIIGTALGIILSKVAGNVMTMETSIDINTVILATLFSASIGIVFGVYPASKAAKLDPIDALRYE
ncbi:ABC transporter permease [Fusibacter sp. 3D3]|uniref:ABC transporter permease n=1 Tax=Fusibacter sp. 3D3 TaxID=1048380 RepID=UPI000852B222|nr:ABC transporter permease [Fusibacter sp. 3D3]GAU77313.1 macrolide export ATP-binding/permease protein MacB [Fusibacter sp. 3D3]